MRINDLHNGLPKVLLFKTFDESVGVMEFISSGSGKPSCGFAFHILNLCKPPIVAVATYIEMGMALESGHLVLGMKRVPLAVARHVMSRVYPALAAIRKLNADASLPIFAQC